jgi:hypothetical protein
MRLTKKQKKWWTVLVVISSLALLATSFLPVISVIFK